MNTVPKLFWFTVVLFLQTLILPLYYWCWSEVCILLCSICNSVSKSPEDSRFSEHHPRFLEVVGDFTDTSFRVYFHSFFYLSVINYCCFLSRSASHWCRWWFPNSLFLHDLCFCYSSNWLPLFFLHPNCLLSLKVSSLVFILFCVCHNRMQDSEYRSNGFNWYDTFPAFNTWRMNGSGHSWSLRKTREAIVPILMLPSDRGMKL